MCAILCLSSRKSTYTGKLTVDQVFYINLEESSSRRHLMEQQFATSTGFPPLKRLAAINGELLGSRFIGRRSGIDDFVEDWLSKVDFDRKISNEESSSFDFPIHASEKEATEANTLACYLSHILAIVTAMEEVKSRSESDESLFLVLEDDVRLQSNWQQSLKSVLEVIPDDFDVLKLLQFCHSTEYAAGDNISSTESTGKYRGAMLLPPVRQSTFPGLLRLGPGLDDGCNLGNAAYILRSSPRRLQRLLEILSKIPVRNVDGVFNLAMDDIRFYSTVVPLASTAHASAKEGWSTRRKSAAMGKFRSCWCTAEESQGACELVCE